MMLVHYITPYTSRKLTRREEAIRFVGEEGTDKHREHILAREAKKLKWKIGDACFFQRNSYEVMNVYTAPSPLLQWDGLMPLLIEIWNGQKLYAVHPKDLKGKR